MSGLVSSDVQSTESGTQVAKVLALLQLTDSAFPTGRYIHSYGLEAFSQENEFSVPAGGTKLLDLLSDSIRLGVAPSDGVALACSHRGASTRPQADLELIVSADSRLTAVKLAKEPRDASRRMGRALLREATSIFGGEALLEYARLVGEGQTPGNHAVVLGLLIASLDIPPLAGVASELYAFAASWVAAAIRLALIDHHEAQDLLRLAQPAIASAALDAVSRSVGDISSCTPLVDVMAMRHEQASVRLFAS